MQVRRAPGKLDGSVRTPIHAGIAPIHRRIHRETIPFQGQGGWEKSAARSCSYPQMNSVINPANGGDVV